MENNFNTEAAIEQLVATFSGEDASARDKHICREALRGLVRLARSEQMLKIKTDVEKLTSSIAAMAPLPAERFPVDPMQRLQRLQCNRAD